jgi:hypothetical protein
MRPIIYFDPHRPEAAEHPPDVATTSAALPDNIKYMIYSSIEIHPPICNNDVLVSQCQKMNTMRSLRFPPLIAMMMILCLGFDVLPSEAFSTTKFSSRRLVIGGRSRAVDASHIHPWHSTTCTFAVFRDDDCEDLCPDFAFGDDSVAATPKMEEDIVANGRMKINNFAQRAPRRSRALWWPVDSEPDSCVSCEGSGEMTCRFCGGTSMMSAIGGDTDALFYEGIGKDCPVCDDGVEACTKCAGTGFVFSWSKAMNLTDSLQP